MKLEKVPELATEASLLTASFKTTSSTFVEGMQILLMNDCESYIKLNWTPAVGATE